MFVKSSGQPEATRGQRRESELESKRKPRQVPNHRERVTLESRV